MSSVIASLPWNRLDFGGKTFLSDSDKDCNMTWSWKQGSAYIFLFSHNLGILDFCVDRELMWMEVRKIISHYFEASFHDSFSTSILQM